MVVLLAACSPPPPAPDPAASGGRPPARLIGLPGSGPSGACNGISTAGDTATVGGTPAGSTDAPSLAPSDAADAAYDLAAEVLADPQLAATIAIDDGSVPIVVTSVDGAGRPEIRQVLADGAADAASSVRAVADDTIRSGGEVLAVEPDQQVRADAAPITNDPLRPNQWALDQFDFEPVWPRGNGSGVCVAVVDSGVKNDHPDLTGRVVASNDWTGEGTAAAGHHGTHVAGIIAAVPDNAAGVVGAAPGVDLLNAKVLTAVGAGFDSWVAAGVIWSVDQGADVVNLSLGASCVPSPPTITCRSSAMQLAMDYARDRDVVVVASAGNDGASSGRWSYPAAFDWPIAVASISSDGTRSSFSTVADYVDVAAPGAGIRSTIANNGYADMSGTSMAAPYVTALAALARSIHPNEMAQQIRDRIVTTTTDRGSPGWDSSYGTGVVNPLLATS